MADNVTVSSSASFTVATDDLGGGVQIQRAKVAFGADGSATDVSTAAPLPVTLANTGANATAVKVDGSAATQPVSDAGGSLTVDAPVGTPAYVRLSDGTSAIATLPVSLASVPSHPVTAASATSGGVTPYKLVSAASTNATSVKGAAGQVYALQVFSTNAAARYLKLYDKATAPTVGTDTPVKTLLIPGGSTGAGVVLQWPTGLVFASGIGFGLTTGAADNDTVAVGAGEVVVNVDFK